MTDRSDHKRASGANGNGAGARLQSPTGAPLERRRPDRRVVAVTGANTFLGRSLVGLLEEDVRVGRIVVLDVRKPPSAARKTIFYEIDLTHAGVESRVAEILNAERVDSLAHLALPQNPTQATAWAHELESVGTMRLLHACRQHPLQAFILASSVLVYGPHPQNPNFLSEAHALRGLPDSSFVGDKIDVERQVRRYAAERPDTRVTVLRFAPLLGPTVDNYVVRWLSRRLVPTAMGHDPLLQFVHEVDAVAALKHAVDVGIAGEFNVVSDGVLPVSTVVRLAGRVGLPIPYGVLRGVTGLMWAAQLSEAPASLVAALRYLCVADGALARRSLGFVPAYSSRDAVLDFECALRLREARLLERSTT